MVQSVSGFGKIHLGKIKMKNPFGLGHAAFINKLNGKAVFYADIQKNIIFNNADVFVHQFRLNAAAVVNQNNVIVPLGIGRGAAGH
jgi:hypothetical protein